jgi:hypothetical protein
MKLHTTKNLLKQHHACTDSYKKLVNHLGSDWPDDKPINLLVAFDIHDDIKAAVEDCLWCFRATIEDYEKEKRIIAAKFAERPLPRFEKRYPDDDRPRVAIQSALEDWPEAERKKAAADADAAAAYAYAADAANAANAAYAAAYAAAGAAAAGAYAAYAAYARKAEREEQAKIIHAYLEK